MSDANSNSAAMLATGFGTQALSSIGGAYAQSQALKSQANYQSQQYNFNSKIASIQSEDAIKRGDYASAENLKATTAAVGTERSSSAAGGVDVNSGTVNQAQQDTKFEGSMNSLMIKNNAWREAWGYKNAAIESQFTGEFTKMGLENQAENTLLTGGLNAAGYLASAGFAASGGYARPGGIQGPGMKVAGR